ncbi:MAG: hypothetical protein K9J06_06470 [Flavobacteriales bacterium]|nr:hypothetical protein [Flavobacteriales bacterium]
MSKSNLDSHLQRIGERMAQLSSHPSALSRDLLLGELRQCYDVVLGMSLPVGQPVAIEAPAPAPVKETPMAAAEVPMQAAPVEEAPIAQPVAATVATPVAEERHIPEVRKTVAPAIPKEPVAKENAHTAVKVEKANDLNILAGRLNNKPISDLQSGIPLNEKFGIIRNLFAGNASDFGDAVIKLNNSRSAEELVHYFELLAQRRNWDSENESYQVLLGFVERRAATLGVSDADPDQ